jgi:anti-sigma regulatory factor (Ser/Thr protein kinase)
MLSHACPDAQNVVLGLSELMLNAIEHGNLSITYQEKTDLIEAEALHAEIAHRLALPAYAERFATLVYERLDGKIQLLITDQGNGFDWRKFLDIDPARAFDSHGRGIAMARMLSFSELEYRGRGNEVLAVVNLSPPG